MKIEIIAKNHIDSFLTNEDGDKFFYIIFPPLKRGEEVTVSFKDIDCLPSSFVNTAFLPLLKFLSFEQIKSQLSFKDTNSQINKMIKMRFFDEVKRTY